MCYPSLTEENGRPCGGNDNRFAYNVIEHVGFECTDTGAFCARMHRPPSLLPYMYPALYLSLPTDSGRHRWTGGSSLDQSWECD